jgi:DHA1 family tetracycline resistance protein-like MFS transporter
MDKKRISVIFLIVLTNAMAATAVLPMLPIYVEGEFQATPVQAMLVIAAYYASQFVAAPWLGKLSDRFGRRPILIVSQLGTIGSYLLFIFAAPIGDELGVTFGMSGGLVVVYLARLLDGLTDGNVSVAEAYASDISDEKSRAHALGLIGGASGLGHIIGPALAVALSGISLIAPMVGAVVMGIATVLLTIFLLDETLTPEKRAAKTAVAADLSIARLVSSRPTALILVTAFIIGLYIATLFSSLSLYAERVLFANEPAQTIAQNVNFMIMLVGLAAAFSQIFLIAPLVRRWGEQRLVVIGSVLLMASAFGISSGSLPLALASMLAYALGFGMSWPSLQAIMTRFGSKDTAGKRLGLFQSAFSLAFIFAPVIAGFLLQTFGPQAIFYNGALLMGVAAALGIAILHLAIPGGTDRHTAHEPPAESGGLLQRFHH